MKRQVRNWGNYSLDSTPLTFSTNQQLKNDNNMARMASLNMPLPP